MFPMQYVLPKDFYLLHHLIEKMCVPHFEDKICLCLLPFVGNYVIKVDQ